MDVVTRAEELAGNLASVRARIAAACAESGRASDEVKLVVVTKFFPPSDLRVLADLGVRDVGENRHQEAEAKAAELAELGLTWHFVGGLQSNKAAAVAAYAGVVESVDRAKLVAPLAKGALAARAAGGATGPLDVLLQVSLDRPGAEGRSGADPRDLADLAEQVAGADGLRLRGLMAVAPRGEDPATAFARLAETHHDLVAQHPDATWRSAGMSGDLEEAIRAGATHVRVGSAILGPRPSIQ